MKCPNCGTEIVRIVPPNLKVCPKCMKEKTEKRLEDFDRYRKVVEEFPPLEYVWRDEYVDEHGEEQVTLWPLDKKYWDQIEIYRKEGRNYQPYVDPWKAGKFFVKWLCEGNGK